MATFVEHQKLIETHRNAVALGLLVSGVKKDIVLTPRIHDRPDRLALYGWRKLDGRPIQPLTTVHVNWYVDYSHGVRLVRNSIQFGGREGKITDLLIDPVLCAIVSDEGPIDPPQYPTD